jgi:hypothetical protein
MAGFIVFFTFGSAGVWQAITYDSPFKDDRLMSKLGGVILAVFFYGLAVICASEVF